MGQKGQHMIIFYYFFDICFLTATDGRFVFDEEVCEVELIAPNLWDSVSVDESSLLKYKQLIDMVLVMKVNNTKYKIQNNKNTKYEIRGRRVDVVLVVKVNNTKCKIQNTKYKMQNTNNTKCKI